MGLANWLCTNSTKKMAVRIIYPGGHVELHDKPILAYDIMQRNPKCCVTHPNVFRDPSAVVSSETVLILGQKYYVVPKSTIKKLRRLGPKNPRSPHIELYYKTKRRIPNRSFNGVKNSDDKSDDGPFGGSSGSYTDEAVRGARKLGDGCLKFCLVKSKTESRKEREDIKGSPTSKMKDTLPTWQPSLQSINVS